MSSRVLECDYRITNNYINHYNKVVNLKQGWAIGTDVVGIQKSVCNVIAHSSGIVIKVVDYMDGTNMKNDREGWGFGNYVVILHGQRTDGKWIVTEYCHLAHVNNIREGQRVTKGQVLGLMGNTGSSYGAHLHFSYRVYSEKPNAINVHNKTIFVWENPELYLNADLPLRTNGEYRINGIDYSAVFNPEYYLNTYSDLRNAFGSDYNKAWEHFKQYGMKESRQAHKDFNVSIYKNNYEDLRNAFGDNMPAYYKHYCEYGKNEGRNAVTGLAEDYTKSVVPNRFKVKVNGVQKAAYTNYKSACNYANSIGGVVIDGNNGKQIYP